jgi:hypothetical protein
MDKKELEALEELEYAKLNRDQEIELREMELKFNTEFGKDFYFMVMDREK